MHKRKQIILIGGNPKGYPQPFDPKTLSGSRLRKILNRCPLDAKLLDMTVNPNDRPDSNEIRSLLKIITTSKPDHVFFLGRFVERRLKKFIPTGHYLPHPAARNPKDLQHLENTLKQLGRTRQRPAA